MGQWGPWGHWVLLGGEPSTWKALPPPLTLRRVVQEAASSCVSTQGHRSKLLANIWFLHSQCTGHFLCGGGFRILVFSPLLFPLYPNLPSLLPCSPIQGPKGYNLLYSPFWYLRHYWKGTFDGHLFPPRHSGFSRKIRPHYSCYHIWTFISNEINYSSVKPLETTPHPNAAF